MPEGATELVKATELEARLGVSRRTLARWCREGRLGPSIKVGNCRWLLKNFVEAALTPRIATDASTALTSMQ